MSRLRLSCCKPLVEIPRMIREAIAILRRLSGSTHSHQVWRQTSPERQRVRDDVPPQIRRGRIAMQEHNWQAVTSVDKADLGVENGNTTSRMIVFRTNRHG